MQPVAEAVEAASAKPHKLRIRLEEAAAGGSSEHVVYTASTTMHLDAATLLQVRWRGILKLCACLRG